MAASETADGWTLGELRSMSREEALAELDAATWQRWQALHDRLDAAEETRERWRDADETTLDVTVHADDEDLGTTVDVYGNELLVRVDPERSSLRERADRLREEFGDDDRDIESMDAEDTRALATAITGLYREIVVAWNGTRLDAMTPTERDTLFETVRDKWRLRGLFLGLADIIEAVEGEQAERVEAVDSFRGASRRRGHRDT